MERLLCKEMLSNAGLLSENQYAYRSKKSTNGSLMKFLNNIAFNVNRRVAIDVVYTDFRSTFEKIPHDLLISVLLANGVGPKIVRWISEFLSNRTFNVKVDDCLSRTGWVKTGCLQGTVLASQLSVFFVDKVNHILAGRVDFYIFADDIKLVKPIGHETDSESLQGVLNDFTSWTSLMGLELFVNKCEVMRLGPANPPTNYLIGNVPLTRLDEIKDLCIYFSPSLDFSEHAVSIAKKCSRMCSWILRAFILREETYVIPNII